MLSHFRLLAALLPLLWLSSDGENAEDDSNEDKPDESPPEDRDDSEDTDDLGDKGKAALKREREARKAAEKRRGDLEKQIAAYEKEKREADDKAAKDAGEWEKVATAREEELTKLRNDLAARDLKERKAAIAKANGIPDDAIDRLHGETDEELEADAKALARILKAREAPDTDAGERTPPGSKKRDRTKYAEPGRWGLPTRK